MRAVVQRVARASVTVDGEVVGSIGHGLCVLVGVTHDDGEAVANKLAERLWKLRIFNDDEDKMNRSVADVGGSLLVISQFTLYGDATRGNRPSYGEAARPEVAAPLIDVVVDRLRSLGADVATGRFGADMAVELVNDGPVTISLELTR
ncbi:MAG: D-aminoacyl-tRNA deacylase [Acidimicrobiales bacterium]